MRNTDFCTDYRMSIKSMGVGTNTRAQSTKIHEKKTEQQIGFHFKLKAEYHSTISWEKIHFKF